MKRLFLCLLIALANQITFSGWTDQVTGFGNVMFQGVSTVNNNVCWACAGHNPLVLRTSNGGLNWVNVGYFDIDSLFCMSIYAINENVAFVLSGYYDSSNVYHTFLHRTSNAGQNWTNILSQTTGYFDHLSFKDSLNGFLLGDPVSGRWSFWKTSDAGVTWDSSGLYFASEGGIASYNRDLEIIGDSIWFGTNIGRIYYSFDFGNNWSYSTVSCPIILTLTLNGNIGFAAEGCVFKTTNAGLNWNSFNLPHASVIDYFTHVDDKFWYATIDSIYYSSDQGNHFVLDHVAHSFDFYWQISLKKIDSQIVGWAVGQYGTVSKYTSPIGIKPMSSEIPKEFKLSQNYPNPFNPTTKIRFEIPLPPLSERGAGGFVRLVIYDLLGHEVATLINEQLKPGVYEIEWDVGNFSSGVYFYRLQAGSFSESKKMLMLK